MAEAPKQPAPKKPVKAPKMNVSSPHKASPGAAKGEVIEMSGGTIRVDH